MVWQFVRLTRIAAEAGFNFADKDASSADLTGDGERSTECFGDLPTDCQTESGATELASQGSVCLDKRLEDRVTAIFRDADSGIDNCQSESLRAVVSDFCSNRDRSRLCELDGVLDKVRQQLTQSELVAGDHVGEV